MAGIGPRTPTALAPAPALAPASALATWRAVDVNPLMTAWTQQALGDSRPPLANREKQPAHKKDRTREYSKASDSSTGRFQPRCSHRVCRRQIQRPVHPERRHAAGAGMLRGSSPVAKHRQTGSAISSIRSSILPVSTLQPVAHIDADGAASDSYGRARQFR